MPGRTFHISQTLSTKTRPCLILICKGIGSLIVSDRDCSSTHLIDVIASLSSDAVQEDIVAVDFVRLMTMS